MSTQKKYKYNLTFYYQSIVVYIISLLVYILLKAQFTSFSFSILRGDGIIYFFLVILSYTVLSTLFNLIRRKHISFSPDGFTFRSRLREFKIHLDDILEIRIYREHKYHFRGILRTVRIKLKNKPMMIIRPIDYENELEVLNEFVRLRDLLHQKKKEEK